jgi:hypothetical protein
MGVADPRESTERTDHDRNVGYNAHDENCVVVDIEVTEIVHDFEQQPQDSGQSTSAVNAA